MSSSLPFLTALLSFLILSYHPLRCPPLISSALLCSALLCSALLSSPLLSSLSLLCSPLPSSTAISFSYTPPFPYLLFAPRLTIPLTFYALNYPLEYSRVKRLLASAQAMGASEDPVLHLMMAQTCLGLGTSLHFNSLLFTPLLITSHKTHHTISCHIISHLICFLF